ncbi:MAG: hypothetical protein JRJ84_25800 [Deltaproteobacteria bacterium]|nr:hypothetical protein [Deltaproteobacteria bacterium]
MRHAAKIAIAGLAGAFLAVSCRFSDAPLWHDQLQADSPCYRVDLLDGLDETSTTELRDLFQCLNHNGHFSSLEPTVDSLETQGRGGQAAGIDVARAVNAMPEADIDLFALAGVALDLLRQDDRPIDEILDLVLELIYGVRASRVHNGITLTDPAALGRGLLVPLAPVLPAMADALLDDNLRAAVWAGELLADPETKRWVRTFDSLASSTRPSVRDPMQDLLPDLGEAIDAAHSPSNDRWSDATGDSLRDVVVAFTLGIKNGTPIIEVITPEADEILGDPVVRATLPGELEKLHDVGHLQRVPEEVRWLASVDSDGESLSPSELSALASLARLLHDTNRPMVCSLDVWVTVLEVDLGNLAVAILEAIADQDPALVGGGAGLLGTIVGWDLTESLLDFIADTEVCPVLTTDVVDDLGALDLVYDDRADDTLALFIRLLNVLKYGQQSRIPAFVDLASDLHATGAMPPIEEVIRDLGDEPLIDDVIDLVPVLVDPDDHGITAGSDNAADLQDLLGVALWVFERDGGRTGWEVMRPLVQAVVAQQGTWEATDHAGALLSDTSSQTAHLRTCSTCWSL